jgi:hypothetical protein
VSPAPHFLGIGAQRAGTTWLYANLSAQPGIWMPPVKELHFFDEKARLKHRSLATRAFGRLEADARWRRQVRTQWRAWRRRRRRPTLWELRYLLGRPSDAWYLRLFKPGEGRVSGEITPNYMILARADVEHVHTLLPDARIILMVRNPIERAWSGSMMRVKDDVSLESRERSAGAIEGNRSRRLTDYLRALENWSSCFPADRIYLGFMEDVARHPQLLLSGVCEFLGVSPVGGFQSAGRVVHQGAASTMPAGVAARLAEKYGLLARSMAERFGGYADFWAFCADRLQTGVEGSGEIPYPFWQTALWEEWVAAGGRPPDGIQSGTLDRVDRGR